MALLTLAEAKTTLGITGTTFDVELPDYVSAAEEAVAFYCGPVSTTVVQEVVRGAGAIALNTVPVLSLISVTSDRFGTLLTSGLRVNPKTGVIRALAYRLPIREDYYTVTYNAGRADVPLSLKNAARIILKHQWGSRRGAGTRERGDDDTTEVPELGYAVPNRAISLMKPYMLGPSVA